MIAIDSSVWIDFFRDLPSRQVGRLIDAVNAAEVFVPDLVLTEILQGCDTEREFKQLLYQLAPHPILEVVDRDVAIAAARNYRELRERGVTIRKTIDTLIATRCIRDDIPLLYSDRDFDPFVQHLGLRSALDSPGVN